MMQKVRFLVGYAVGTTGYRPGERQHLPQNIADGLRQARIVVFDDDAPAAADRAIALEQAVDGPPELRGLILPGDDVAAPAGTSKKKSRG